MATNISEKLQDYPYQELTITTADGEAFTLTFRYLPTQYFWVLDIDGDSFTAHGLRVCCHANLLDRWLNVCPFGLKIDTVDGLDPLAVDAFESGYCTIKYLNHDDCLAVREYLNGGKIPEDL